jgi:hypothetical protein
MGIIPPLARSTQSMVGLLLYGDVLRKVVIQTIILWTEKAKREMGGCRKMRE